jgi:trk system potassium uptake protein TrkA
MGAGRIGSRVAASLAGDGHDVAVIEPDRRQLAQLPRSLVDDGTIKVVIGDGASAESLLAAGIEDADMFMALAGDDTLNGLAAQKARIVFRVRRVICRTMDEGLRELYTSLGITVASPTSLVTDAILHSVPEGP